MFASASWPLYKGQGGSSQLATSRLIGVGSLALPTNKEKEKLISTA